jgi:uncharacterized membrane protein YhaH (DUF805 family)
MKQFFTTRGRISRSTYWKYFGGFYAAILILVKAFDLENNVAPMWLQFTFGIAFLAFLPIAIVVKIKRWHDLDKSGWWLFLVLIPCVGAIWTVIECGFFAGTPGPNRFGPNPLGNEPPSLPRR